MRIRPGRRDDVAPIEALYREVGATPGGIARAPDEVTRDYVEGFVSRSLDRGIILVAELEGLVVQDHPDITRVELITSETNHRALRLYEGMGFRREGRLAGRVMWPDGTLDADIPLAWFR